MLAPSSFGHMVELEDLASELASYSSQFLL